MSKISLIFILFSLMYAYQDCNNNAIGGNALAFDGVDDRIDVPDSHLINKMTVNQRTIECWFKVVDKSINSRKQVIYEEGGRKKGLNIYIFDNSLYVGGFSQSNHSPNWTGTFLSTTAINSGQWHHVALVLDGNGTVLPDVFTAYLDGQLYGSGEGSRIKKHKDDIGIASVDGKTLFHDGQSSNPNPFEGVIDELRIWNEVRTQVQLQQNMHREITLIPANLVAYWQMNETSGLSATDVSGNGNDGTLTNMSGTEWLASTAPIPFVTVADGNWSSPATWLSNTVPNSIGAMVTLGHSITLDTDITLADIELTSGGALTNSASNLTVKGDFYSCGSFTASGGSTSFSGDTQQSVDGTSLYTLFDVQINNGVAGLTLTDEWDVKGTLTVPNGNTLTMDGGDLNFSGSGSGRVDGSFILVSGQIHTTMTNLLTIGATGIFSLTATGCSTFVDGPLAKETPAYSDNFSFPIGDVNGTTAQVRPLEIQTSSANTFVAEYYMGDHGQTNTGSSDLTRIQRREYWQLDRSAGSGNALVTLHWGTDGAPCYPSEMWRLADNIFDLRVAEWNSATAAWDDLGQSGYWDPDPCTNSMECQGSITSGYIDSFGMFTIGSSGSTLANDENDIAMEYKLAPVYPNPFNPVTNIRFSVPVRGQLQLTVFNLQGVPVETLANEWFEAGDYLIQWDANQNPSGIYFVRLEAGDFSSTQKMILLK